MTGMRRNEVLGLTWSDLDVTKKRLNLNRGLVAVGYEIHQTRGKTKTARRAIDLDDTTIAVLEGWRAYQAAEFAAVGIDHDDDWVFTDGDGEPIHPHAVYEAFRRIVHNAGIPTMRFHDLRHTHGSRFQGRRPRQGRVRAARPRAHRPHASDLPARPARHAGRRGTNRRTARRPATDAQEAEEADRQVVGGTSWEQPEEGRLIR